MENKIKAILNENIGNLKNELTIFYDLNEVGFKDIKIVNSIDIRLRKGKNNYTILLYWKEKRFVKYVLLDYFIKYKKIISLVPVKFNRR